MVWPCRNKCRNSSINHIKKTPNYKGLLFGGQEPSLFIPLWQQQAQQGAGAMARTPKPCDNSALKPFPRHRLCPQSQGSSTGRLPNRWSLGLSQLVTGELGGLHRGADPRVTLGSRLESLAHPSTLGLAGVQQHNTLPSRTLPFPVISSVFRVNGEIWASLLWPATTALPPSPPGMMLCRFCFSSTMQENHRSSLFRIPGQACSQLKYCRKKQWSKEGQLLPSPSAAPRALCASFPGAEGSEQLHFAR